MLYLFFFLMLLLPTQYQAFRGIILFLLVFSHFRSKGLSVYPLILRLWIANFILFLFSTLYGVIVGNPGALGMATVDLIWPTLYLYFMMVSHSNQTVINLYKVIIYGGCFVSFVNAFFLANAIVFNIGFITAIATALGGMYGVSDGFVEFFMPSADFAPYFLYFGSTLLLLNHDYIDIKKKYIILLVVLSVLLILLSARRISWLLVCALPLILLFFFKICRLKNGVVKKIISVSLPLGLLLLGVIIYFLDVNIVIAQFNSSFEMELDESNYVRAMQFKSLTNDFLQHPIFGRGQGYVSSFVSTPESPSEYEMSYSYMLGGKGLVGAFIIFGSYFIVLLKSIRAIRRSKELAGFVLPPILGLICLSIMNITNPYLNKFDFLWIFFLPIIVLNNLYFNKYSINGKKSKETKETNIAIRQEW